MCRFPYPRAWCGAWQRRGRRWRRCSKPPSPSWSASAWPPRWGRASVWERPRRGTTPASPINATSVKHRNASLFSGWGAKLSQSDEQIFIFEVNKSASICCNGCIIHALTQSDVEELLSIGKKNKLFLLSYSACSCLLYFFSFALFTDSCWLNEVLPQTEFPTRLKRVDLILMLCEVNVANRNDRRGL